MKSEHIFSDPKDLREYLSTQLIASCVAMGVDIKEHKADILGLMNICKTFAGEHHFLVEEGKMNPYTVFLDEGETMEDARKDVFNEMEDLNKIMGLKYNKEDGKNDKEKEDGKDES